MVTGGILQYSEDLNFTANEDIGAKDFFEIACKQVIGEQYLVQYCKR